MRKKGGTGGFSNESKKNKQQKSFQGGCERAKKGGPVWFCGAGGPRPQNIWGLIQGEVSCQATGFQKEKGEWAAIILAGAQHKKQQKRQKKKEAPTGGGRWSKTENERRGKPVPSMSLAILRAPSEDKKKKTGNGVEKAEKLELSPNAL